MLNSRTSVIDRDTFYLHLCRELQDVYGILEQTRHPHFLVRLAAVKSIQPHLWRPGVIDRLFQLIDDNSWVIQLATLAGLIKFSSSNNAPLSGIVQSRLIQLFQGTDRPLLKGFVGFYLLKTNQGRTKDTIDALAFDEDLVNLALINLFVSADFNQTMLSLLPELSDDDYSVVEWVTYQLIKMGPIYVDQLRLFEGFAKNLDTPVRQHIIFKVISEFSTINR